MHEMAIAMALIEQVEGVAREQNASAIAGIRIVAGRLSGVDPDALKAVFELAAEETLAAGASLTVEMREATVTCRACGRESQPKPPFMACVACGSRDVTVEGGRELYIKSVDVDVKGEG